MGPMVVVISPEEQFSGLPARAAGIAGNDSDLAADGRWQETMELLPE
jgi:hypothetical protein